MPRLDPTIVRAILTDAMSLGGDQVHVPANLDGVIRVAVHLHGTKAPTEFRIAVRTLTRDTRTAGVWVPRLKIQTTSLQGVRASDVDALLGIGLVGGVGVFVAFDRGHQLPATGGSNNVQCPEDIVLAAAASEVPVFHRKPTTGEQLVAFTSQHLIPILLEIGGATDGEIAKASDEVAWETTKRRRRDSTFRARVLQGFEHRCAACGYGLGSAEAAHIVPHCVSLDDRTENGLALCPNHHAAYDSQDLLTFAPDRTILVNAPRMALYAEVEPEGVETFLGALMPRLVDPGFDQGPWLEIRYTLDQAGEPDDVWLRPSSV